jgi:hypothetical protein
MRPSSSTSNSVLSSGRSICARYPDRWPAEMRADVVAALFDIETTGQLWKAIARGEAPRPSACRTRNGRRESVWALEICRAFIARRHDIKNNGVPDAEDIRSLL